ncbi:MAG TPA: hypothetical protein VGC92_05275, partial [Phenylobacterium sp.]
GSTMRRDRSPVAPNSTIASASILPLGGGAMEERLAGGVSLPAHSAVRPKGRQDFVQIPRVPLGIEGVFGAFRSPRGEPRNADPGDHG